MTPERWQRVDQLLEAALEREASQRTVFLDEDLENGQGMQPSLQVCCIRQVTQG